jgi:hypothetical protein
MIIWKNNNDSHGASMGGQVVHITSRLCMQLESTHIDY